MHITKDLVAASRRRSFWGSSPKVRATVTQSSSRSTNCRAGSWSGPTACSTAAAPLGAAGHVESAWETPPGGRRRKYYRITDQGWAELVEQRRQWATVVDALRGVWNTPQSIKPITAPAWEAGR